MKNIYRTILTAVALCLSTLAFADRLDSLKLNKVATPNGDGTYTLTLDTYVIGEYSEETTVVKTTNPVDFVLCLDVSGSMADPLPNSTRLGNKGNYNGLDKSKGAREGYYSAIRRGLLGTSYEPVRYINNNWEYNYGGWRKIDDSWASGGVDIYKSKLGSLMDACDAFLNKIEQSQTEGGLNGSNGHKVGIVTFSTGATNVLSLTSINSKSTIENKIHALTAGGATYAHSGMSLAKDMLNLNASGNGRSKVLVLFTDGEPNGMNNQTSGFVTDVADSCIVIAKSVKAAKASVFSINVLEAAEGTNMWKYMNYVSSNFPSATDLEHSGDRESNKYYHLATNESALNAAFEAVVTESLSKEGGAGIQLNVSEVTLRDIVTPSFVIPTDLNGDPKVRVYEVPVNTTIVPDSHEIDDISFASVSENDKNVAPANVTVNINVDDKTGKSTIDVQGFDFSAKWVGYRHAKKNNSETWSVNPGSKLVVEIIVTPNPTKEGGHVSTNDPESGIYVGDQTITEPIKEYPVPEVFTPKNLIIKSGALTAGKGESMLFKVTRSDDPSFSMIIAMTEGGEQTQVIAQLPVKDSNNNNISYTVTPINNWAWAYGEVNAITHDLLENNVFEFTPGSTSSTKKHAENSKNNQFNAK